MVRAAILAGGKGTRIDSLFPDLPKPMIPVSGKPVLQWQIELLTAHGISDMTLITGYKSDIIKNHFGNGRDYNAHISYIVEDEPLGTGGALSLLPRGDTLILLGDLYCCIDIMRFVRFHYEHKAGITLFTHPNSHPYDSDIIETDGDNRVKAWKSKKDAYRGELRNLVNAGLYVLSGELMPSGDMVKRDLERDIIIPKITDGVVYSYRSTEYVKDMGTPERLQTVECDIKNGVASARNLNNKQHAVFIDRDGVINEEVGFITSPNQLHLIPGAAQAVKKLNKSPYLAICVTNQPVIARGEVTLQGLDTIHARLDTLLGEESAFLDYLLFCPHHPDTGFDGEVAEYKITCECRKPKPGMLLEAAERYNIDLARSYMIGDRTTDIAAGQAVGCVTIGLRTGEALLDGKVNVKPDIVCDDLLSAVSLIAGISKENIQL